MGRLFFGLVRAGLLLLFGVNLRGFAISPGAAVRGVASARTDARGIYREEIKRQIMRRYRRRTGALLKVRVRGTGKGQSIRLREDFPSTAYPGGQYAYVLNSRSGFIDDARSQARRRIRRETLLRYIQFTGE